MEWRYLTEVAETVKILTRELDHIEEICKSYWKLLQKEKATPKELENVNELTKCLIEIQAELRNVQEKAASEEILITFAGPTSSGKSSVINALLRTPFLPVGFMQTTMCSIKVCTTKEKEWSVIVKRENGELACLARLKNEKDARDTLSQISGQRHANDRKEIGIGTHSVVQLNLPKHLLQVLPLNVVLFDTPGLGEDSESDEFITESCRRADIIVAVMDSFCPSISTVARLVDKANCQYTFGVFTKWDQLVKRTKEEGEDPVDDEISKSYKQEFQNVVEGQCEVFFVDVKYENTNDAGFKRFERKLQASATKLKGESLIKQAKFVNEKSIKIAERFKSIVDAKKEQKAASIEKKQTSMKEAEDSFSELRRELSLKRAEELMEGAFKENTKRIEDFEKGVREGKPEDEVHAEFITKVDKCTRDTLIRQGNEIRSAFTNWAKKHNCDLDVNKFLSDIDDIPLCEKQGLSEEEYNWKRDPNVYYTNNYLASAMLLGGTVGGTMMGAAGIVGFAGMFGAVATFGGAGLLRTGNLVKWLFPISEYKVNCWRQKLRCNLLKLYRDCRDLVLNDIKRIEDKAVEKLDHTKAENKRKIQKEERKSHNLTTWAEGLQESHMCLTERNKELDELLTELLRTVEKSPAQRDAVAL